MNWQEIKLSECGAFFSYQGDKVFNKTFINALKFHAPGFAPVQEQEGWLHINANGEQLYKERHKRAFGFYCNRAGIVGEEGWFHIDDKGIRLYSECYAWVGNYQEDKCVVRDFSNNYFHINLSGRRIYSEEYFYAGDYKEGCACVKGIDGWKHINSKGEDLNNKRFEDLGVFHKSYATARDKAGWFHIDKKGVDLYPNRFASTEPFYNGCSLVEDFNSKKCIISEAGDVVFVIA